MVYKDIDEVMAAQADLVESLARFQPSIVKMAPAGERPDVCTYALDSGLITVTFDLLFDPVIFSGSITGSTITVTFEGDVFVFRK